MRTTPARAAIIVLRSPHRGSRRSNATPTRVTGPLQATEYPVYEVRDRGCVAECSSEARWRVRWGSRGAKSPQYSGTDFAEDTPNAVSGQRGARKPLVEVLAIDVV